jgi:hypothetical protein
VFLRWKGMESSAEGDFYVRSGPGTVKLKPGDIVEYIRTRFSMQPKVSETAGQEVI